MDWIQMIIQGGAVGIAAYLIFTMNQLITNHLGHNTRALQQLTIAIEKLISAIRKK